jgi:hypothetical protein
MNGLPSDLYKQIRNTLLDCGPFDSNDNLRQIFVDEHLEPWRHSVPEVNNREDRVEALVALLIDKYHTRYGNALLAFLNVIQQRKNPNDTCFGKLEEAAICLKNHLPQIKVEYDDNNLKEYIVSLANFVTNSFSKEELKQLCFDLGVDYEDLPGNRKLDKAREFVLYFARRNDLAELADGILKERPHAALPIKP